MEPEKLAKLLEVAHKAVSEEGTVVFGIAVDNLEKSHGHTNFITDMPSYFSEVEPFNLDYLSFLKGKVEALEKMPDTLERPYEFLNIANTITAIDEEKYEFFNKHIFVCEAPKENPVPKSVYLENILGALEYVGNFAEFMVAQNLEYRAVEDLFHQIAEKDMAGDSNPRINFSALR
ncbi:MAG: hypothetical protein ACTSXQ_04825 [Alphaproteobacteria bacterium]